MNRLAAGVQQGDLISLEVAIEDALRTEKARIINEIRSYPPPIPACDAQFNYLIERRDRVSQELSQLYAIVRDMRAVEAQSSSLGQFIAASACLDSKTKEALLHRFEKGWIE